MKRPRTPTAIFKDINHRFFNDELTDLVVFRWVEDNSEGDIIDTRCDYAAVAQGEEGGWLVELNRGLQKFYDSLYLMIAHEMLHMWIPKAKHYSKEWNREVRRLQGLGLLRRVF